MHNALKHHEGKPGWAKLIETEYGFLVLLHNGVRIRKNTNYKNREHAETAYADAVEWLTDWRFASKPAT